MTNRNIDLTTEADMPGLQSVLDQTALFPAAMLPDLLAPFLSDHTTALWLTCRVGTTPRGFCYAAPEPMTDGTWNLRAIAIAPVSQGQGLGTALVTEMERRLHDMGQRLLIIDTSGTDTFRSVRQFYHNLGYREDARLADFWAAGDDRVTFVKRLPPAIAAS